MSNGLFPFKIKCDFNNTIYTLYKEFCVPLQPQRATLRNLRGLQSPPTRNEQSQTAHFPHFISAILFIVFPQKISEKG